MPDEANKAFANIRRNPKLDTEKDKSFREWVNSKLGDGPIYDEDFLRTIYAREQENTAQNRFSDLQNTLSPEEIRVIKELRKVEWGKVTVVKKGGAVVMITPAPDIKVSK